MTPRDLKKAINELRKSGLTDNQIVIAFCRMFLDDRIDGNGLNGLLGGLGLSMPDEFDTMSLKDQKELVKRVIEESK